MSEKVEDKPDPYAEDRRKQAAQLKKIQGYLNRAQTIVKEVRIQQVLFPVSLTRLDGVECGPRRSSRADAVEHRRPTPSTRRRHRDRVGPTAWRFHAIDET